MNYVALAFKGSRAALCLLVFTAALASAKTPKPGMSAHRPAADTAATLTINLQAEKQTIHSFGASDCWTTKYIGRWANMAKRNQVADYLFSTATDAQGNPRGIGLSLWRFNIGAGSFEQEAESGIKDESRREECFLNPDGTYDWGKQAGQQWFLQAAKARGVKYLLAFTNSPPVQFTVNNKAYGLGNNQLNLQPQKQDAFATFLIKVLQYFSTTNTPFNYISPFNEPQWNWGEKPNQEGTGATNTQMAGFLKLFGPRLKASKLNTTITFGEAGKWNALDSANKDGRGNQLHDFFSPASANYIGNVPALEPMFSAHSYFTTCPETDLVKYRQSVVDKRNAVMPGLKLWQTEFGVLGNICGQLNGGPRHTDIDYGLYVAKVIHNDLVVAGVNSWQWWLAVNTYNYSDGLVYINDPAGGLNHKAIQTDGRVSTSKQLWCMGNFSRFVRPGMVRVDAGISNIKDAVTAAGSVMVSAYKSTADKQLVVVVVNTRPDAVQYRLNLGGNKPAGKQLTAYTTSATQDLQKSIMKGSIISLPGKTVTTLVLNYR